MIFTINVFLCNLPSLKMACVGGILRNNKQLFITICANSWRYTGIYVHPYSTVLITMKQDVPYVKLCNVETTDYKTDGSIITLHESLMNTHSRLVM